ncbi:hypothetical protein LZZ90_13885 [Flavobacterium sp. SM15]|uniref:hypothetical protein n=1 Tax=Flavobacterium sp. SM15 TaxID=2908005 RepID=UPI001EDC88A5|nr:hypothetical protein [Flavobacterium sp. SM15]MCG2612596.1 hypothetical protein [Flavobacterium sp. SM15]
MKNNNEYKIAIFGAFASIIFTAIYDFIKAKPILSTFWNLLKWIWNHIFEFQLKIWQILIFFITIWIIKSIIKVFKKPNENLTTQNDADWLNYTEDNINGLNWRWKWIKNVLTHKWNIEDLTIACNKCGTSMHLDDSYVYGKTAECPRCENRIRDYKDLVKIEAIIIDNVKRDMYKK